MQPLAPRTSPQDRSEKPRVDSRRKRGWKVGEPQEGGAHTASPSTTQLFRRVASALPGMENVQEKSKEGSILFLGRVSAKCAGETFHFSTEYHLVS